MDSMQGTLPIRDRRWFGFPLQARFASISASQSGIDVTIESVLLDYRTSEDCLVWSGSEKQLRSSGYFDSLRTFPQHHRWCYPGNLRGHLRRTGRDRFRFAIEWVYTGKTPRLFRKQSSRALECSDYCDFREKLLRTTEST
jgi:hypothetical protein